METVSRTTLYSGLFTWQPLAGGRGCLVASETRPTSVADPETGRSLRVSTIQANAHAICPACDEEGEGGFVSFEPDIRLAYACPSCRRLVWILGA
jgi:hypothetical protein